MCAEAGMSSHKRACVTRSLSYFHGNIPTPHQSVIFRTCKRLQVTTLLKLKTAFSNQSPLILNFDGKAVAPYDYGIKEVERMSLPFSQRDQFLVHWPKNIREEPPKI